MKKKVPFRKFLIIWSGQLLSSIGTGLSAFALGAYAFRLTGSAAVYSLIILTSFLPAILLKPIGGVLCDRFNRPVMMILGNMGSAIGLGFIVYMLHLGMEGLWVIYTGTMFNSFFAALHNPAYKACVTDLLNEESFSKASGFMQLSESAQFVLSPIIAGCLMSKMDVEYVIILDILSFFIASLMVLQILKINSMQKNETGSSSLFQDLKQGFHYVYKEKSLISLLLITSLFAFFIGLLQSLLGPMILVFETEKTLGVITSISATGMIFSSLFIGLFGKSDKKIPLLSVGLFVAGIFYSLLGVSTSIWFLIFSGFFFFAALPFVNTSLDVLVRRNVATQIQGRVWSIVSLISQFGMILAFGIAGLLADNIFNPLFINKGRFSTFFGHLVGIGPGRGIGFMFLISGIAVSIVAIIIGNMKILKKLDKQEGIKKMSTLEVAQ